jgi:hypothetical protein
MKKQTVEQRREIADNPSTPVDVLEQLAVDEDRDVRWRVARNPSTSVDVLKQLATDENLWIKLCVARNPSIPLDSDTFQDLMIDPDPVVRAATMERLQENLEKTNTGR